MLSFEKLVYGIEAYREKKMTMKGMVKEKRAVQD